MVILGVMLPGMNGYEFCKWIRARSDLPIIMVSARDEEVDCILGLELGSDDYLAKPFSPRELVARVRTVFRRMRPSSSLSYEMVETPTALPSCGRLVLRNTVRLLCEIPGEPVLTAVDPEKMVQVIINLVGNAIRHSKHQVFIRLRVDDCYILIVEDDGDGFCCRGASSRI